MRLRIDTASATHHWAAVSHCGTGTPYFHGFPLGSWVPEHGKTAPSRGSASTGHQYRRRMALPRPHTLGEQSGPVKNPQKTEPLIVDTCQGLPPRSWDVTTSSGLHCSVNCHITRGFDGMVTKGQLVFAQTPAQYAVTNICQQKTHTAPRCSDSVLEHGGATLLSPPQRCPASRTPSCCAPSPGGSPSRHPWHTVRSAPARHHPTGSPMPLHDEEPTDT